MTSVVARLTLLSLLSIFLIFSAEFAQAQSTRLSCKDSGREYSVAQRKSEKLTSQITKTKSDLQKLEAIRQRNLQRLDERLKKITENTANNTAKCYAGTGITNLIKGKGDYQKCLERAKKSAAAAAERAAKASLAVKQQREKVNSSADAKKALLTQKVVRLEGELSTQQALATSAKVKYDACIASGGVA